MSTCSHDYSYRRYCAAEVCADCGDHKNLVRCYCGWSLNGEDGRRELEELGEHLDEEERFFYEE